MEKVFDSLRKEIEENAADVGGAKVIGLHQVRIIINKAESKQETKCCEWKPVGDYGWLVISPHDVKSVRNREDLEHRPYCEVCGNRVKVKECE